MPGGDLADSLRPAAPERHLLSKYLKHAASVTFLGMHDGASTRDRTRLWSASGPTAGSAIVSELNVPGVALTDRQWSEALRWRLGVAAQASSDAQCRNVKSKDSELCGETLDRHGDHAAICLCGPWANFRHNDLAEVYADILQETGGYVRARSSCQSSLLALQTPGLMSGLMAYPSCQIALST